MGKLDCIGPETGSDLAHAREWLERDADFQEVVPFPAASLVFFLTEQVAKFTKETE